MLVKHVVKCPRHMTDATKVRVLPRSPNRELEGDGLEMMGESSPGRVCNPRLRPK